MGKFNNKPQYYRTDWIWPTGNETVSHPHPHQTGMVYFVPKQERELQDHHRGAFSYQRLQRVQERYNKIIRKCVDGTRRRRTRNFGDYDPVRSRTPPEEYHNPNENIGYKERKRRVIYTGMPSEAEMVARVKLKQRMDYFSKFEEEETYEVETEGYNNSSVGRHPHHSATHSGFETGGGHASLNQQGGNGNAGGPRGPMLDDRNNAATVNKPARSRWEWDIGPNSNRNTTDTRDMSSNFGGFGGNSRMQSSASASATSSWMQYTGGTGGFYNPSAASSQAPGSGGGASNVASDDQQSFEPFEYGYTTGKQGASGNVVEDFDSGSNEVEFCHRINNLNIYYELKMLPNQQNHGKIYYGFELQFWPYNDPSGKEVVWGLRMMDLSHAKDSAFAAALAKLPHAGESDEGSFPYQNQNVDPPSWNQNQGVRKPENSAQSATSFSDRREGYKVTFSTASGAREASAYSLAQQRTVSYRDRAAPAQPTITVRDDLREREPTHLISRNASTAASSSRPDFKNPAQQQQAQFTPMSYQNPRQCLQSKAYRSVVSNTEDGGFRIAIPRDPSIVWDTKQYRKQVARRENYC